MIAIYIFWLLFSSCNTDSETKIFYKFDDTEQKRYIKFLRGNEQIYKTEPIDWIFDGLRFIELKNPNEPVGYIFDLRTNKLFECKFSGFKEIADNENDYSFTWCDSIWYFFVPEKGVFSYKEKFNLIYSCNSLFGHLSQINGTLFLSTPNQVVSIKNGTNRKIKVPQQCKIIDCTDTTVTLFNQTEIVVFNYKNGIDSRTDIKELNSSTIEENCKFENTIYFHNVLQDIKSNKILNASINIYNISSRKIIKDVFIFPNSVINFYSIDQDYILHVYYYEFTYPKLWRGKIEDATKIIKHASFNIKNGAKIDDVQISSDEWYRLW